MRMLLTRPGEYSRKWIVHHTCQLAMLPTCQLLEAPAQAAPCLLRVLSQIAGHDPDENLFHNVASKPDECSIVAVFEVKKDIPIETDRN